MPSPFYPASILFLQLHGGMVSLMQALATPSSTVHKINTWILTMKAYQVWLLLHKAVIRDVASGADRHLDITFIQIAGS